MSFVCTYFHIRIVVREGSVFHRMDLWRTQDKVHGYVGLREYYIFL